MKDCALYLIRVLSEDRDNITGIFKLHSKCHTRIMLTYYTT